MNENKAVYIHIDGMDLAGKTTTAKGIASKVPGEWSIRTNSLSGENAIYMLADTLRKQDAYTPEILGHLYTVAMRADIHSFCWPDTNTIQDSTIILRSLAYHTVSGNINITAVLNDILPTHPRFDSSIVLIASIEARRQRLDQRMVDNPEEVAPDDLMVIRRPEKFLAMEACLKDMATNHFGAKVIDTSQMTPAMVVDEVVQNLPTAVIKRLNLEGML